MRFETVYADILEMNYLPEIIDYYQQCTKCASLGLMPHSYVGDRLKKYLVNFSHTKL